jgi:transketolase
LTHDSISIGCDGPTHQPVEQLPSLRAVPNLLVIRPADAVETAEAWKVALAQEHSPTALFLARERVPTLPRPPRSKPGLAKGAYVFREPESPRQVTLIATGEQVGMALEAAEALAAENIAAAVVSAPCFELFRRQPEGYRQSVLGTVPRVGIEPAAEGEWSRWLGEKGVFIGMHSFGTCGTAAELYENFGITPRAIVEAARRLARGESAAGSSRRKS